MKSILKIIAVCSLVAFVAVSCGKKSGEAAKTDGVSVTVGDFNLPASGVTFTLNGTPVTLAGVTFTPPSEWTDFGPSGMRKASYAFGPIKGETDSATVTVFYFGQGGGGTIEANLDRWVGQMVMPEGSNPDAFVQKGEMMVGDMKVHLLKVEGTFKAGGMMMTTPVEKENYLMVGVVVEAPEGNIFFKMTGPKETGAAMAEALIAMVKDIK